MFLKTAVALGVVLCLFGGAVMAFRKFSGVSKSFLGGKGRNLGLKPLEILAFQSLGQGKSLYLLRCLDKKVLVGATATQITHITDIVDEDDESTDFDPVFNDKVSTKSESNSAHDRTLGSGLREISRV